MKYRDSWMAEDIGAKAALAEVDRQRISRVVKVMPDGNDDQERLNKKQIKEESLYGGGSTVRSNGASGMQEQEKGKGEVVKKNGW